MATTKKKAPRKIKTFQGKPIIQLSERVINKTIPLEQEMQRLLELRNAVITENLEALGKLKPGQSWKFTGTPGEVVIV